MFFLIERVETVSLAPQFFNANLQKEVHRALRAKMEGKCSGRWGYTIAITTVYPLGKGRLDEDSGYAHFEVKYISLVMRPFKNEIIMAKVHTITNNGFFASAGPMEIFVSQYVGGQRQGLPDDLKFDSTSAVPLLYSTDENLRIEINSEVRVKIIGLRMATDQIWILGTIKEDFLG